MLRKEERLPGYTLYSSEVFDLENRIIFQKMWICLGAPHLQIERGGAMPLQFLDQPFIITRDTDDSVNVFFNVCRHRGAEVLCEKTKRSLLTCPYHGWTYGLDGKCIATPHVAGESLHDDPQLEKSALGLTPVRSRIWSNLLFVCLDNAAPDFEVFMAPVISRCGDRADMNGFEIDTSLSAPFDLNGNWKLVAENFVDAYHVPFVHRALQQINPMADHSQLLGGACYAGQSGSAYSPEYSQNDWTASTLKGIKVNQGEYLAFFIFPNLIFTVFDDHAFSIAFEPKGPTLTSETVNFHFAGKSGLSVEGAKSRESFAKFLTLVNSEDIAIVESMQRTRQSVGFDGGHFTPAHDNAAEHLQRLYAWRLLRGLGEADEALGELPFADISDGSKSA